MYKPGGTIKDALDKIAKNEYVLPAIQREFVWKPDQICRLFDSVMRGYPFGTLLFWHIEPDKSADYRYYGFVLDYHQRDNPHCPDLGILANQPIKAVLDGQQRLTAFNIGLRGSMAIKNPYMWWSSRNAFPKKVLALDLLTETDQSEEETQYSFKFVEEHKIGHDKNQLLFKVSDILKMDSGPDMLDWIMDKDLGKEENKRAFHILNRLHIAIHTDPIIHYYEESNQDIEHVLKIFIRCNSGGTFLSYSDLLLSIATSQWEDRDARKEVHQLVDELNQIGPGLELSKDFVLKAGLMLTDIPSIAFKVRNFTQRNMLELERSWHQIRETLISTVQLVIEFGFDAKSIRAASALLPIAYYLHQINSPNDFHSNSRYAKDRETIHAWLIRSILKASGIWGSGLDTLLTELRNVISKTDHKKFPIKEIHRVMSQRGKSLEFSEEEIEDLADMRISDRRIFALLALLFPFIDLQHHHFHIDHVFPKSRFTPTCLKKARIDETHFADMSDRADRIGNLQLLEGKVNIEKRAKMPADWIENRFTKPLQRQRYCDTYLLGEVPREMGGFLRFYDARRNRLKYSIAAKLLNVRE